VSKIPSRPAPRLRKRGIATRRRIVEAAYAAIQELGYSGMTMSGVATSAGVSVQAVHFFFQNKLGLFQATWHSTVMGVEDLPPQRQEWFERMLEEPDPRRAIRVAIDSVIEINSRMAPLEAVLEVYGSEPGMAEFRASDERRRFAGFRDVLRTLSRKAPLRAGLTLDDATVILMTVNSPASYRMAVSRLGWAERRYSNWVAEVVASTIFGLTPEPKRGTRHSR
jgi:AcrR family transcriptional regulator